MTLHTSSAARAAWFMRQCRSRQPLALLRSHNSPASRFVSSSHLAPSNFSKQTRRRDTEVESPRLANKSNGTRLPSHIKKRFPLPNADPYPPNAEIPAGFFNFLKYRIFGYPPPIASRKPPSFNVLNNPYRARKTWPPDFSSMHTKQQFHFEKTFRRRMLLKTNSQRYNWNRYIKLLQQSLIVLTVIYFIFIADPYAKDGGGTPVDGFRAWFFGQVAKFEHLPDGLREHAEEMKEYYGKNWRKAPWAGDEEEEEKKRGDDNASPVRRVEEGRSSG